MQRPYRVIFFDLDHTLWDYDTNSVEALSELYHKYELQNVDSLSLDNFLNTFTNVNNRLWNNYNKGHIDRDDIRKKRFLNILKTFGVDDEERSLKMSDEYIEVCPQKTNLFPYTFEVLEYLKAHYQLFILTNGFDDVQQIKISRSQLAPYFEGMITSENSGHRKPSKEIFDFALSQANAQNHESLMIGDNLSTDIAGAKNAAIDSVYFNPHKQAHKAETKYEICCLSELMEIL